MMSQINDSPTRGKEARADNTVDLREPDVTPGCWIGDWEQPADCRFEDVSRTIRVPILASSTIEIIPVRLRSIRH